MDSVWKDLRRGLRIPENFPRNLKIGQNRTKGDVRPMVYNSTMKNKRTAEHQRRVIELRRSNATTPIQSKKAYKRKSKYPQW